MAEIDYKARVDKGVALLDSKRPGWDDLIDLEILDIREGDRCVSAQLSGSHDWRDGRDQLGLTRGDSGTYVAYGFNAESGCKCCTSEVVAERLPEGYDSDDAFATLNTLWREIIESRRTAGSAASV